MCSASRTTLSQVQKKAHQQNQKPKEPNILSANETEISSLAFLKDYVEWDRYKVFICLLLFFPVVPSPSVYWVLLSELREIVRHKPPSLVIRKGAMLSAWKR